jgi:hypothetical protein
MAQTKSRSSGGRSSSSQRGPTSRRGSKATSARGNSRSGRSKSRSTRNRQAEHSVADAASGAGRTVGNIASKAKAPALATGAAAAGLAGGMFIASRKSRTKLFGVLPLPRPGGTMESVGKGLLKASENVGQASQSVGQLTEEVRRMREGIEADNKRRSPIEVVLDGLTHRTRA